MLKNVFNESVLIALVIIDITQKKRSENANSSTNYKSTCQPKFRADDSTNLLVPFFGDSNSIKVTVIAEDFDIRLLALD